MAWVPVLPSRRWIHNLKGGLVEQPLHSDGKGGFIHWKRWKQAGILTIHDLCHETNEQLLSHSEINDRFNVSLLSWITQGCVWEFLCRVQNANSWLQGWPVPITRCLLLLWNNTPREDHVFKETLPGNGVLGVSTQNKWDNIINIDDCTEWRDIYLHPFKTSRETKLQVFQFRLAQGLITCNSLLKRYRIKTDDSYLSCGHTDKMEHFFVFCQVSRTFWNYAILVNRLLVTEWNQTTTPQPRS